MRIVIALGGNALLRRGEPMTAATQRANIAVTAAAIAPLALAHDLIVTHGNGPQVGLLALQNEAHTDAEGYPLDVLDAETEGMIGYLLELELARHLASNSVVTVLTQVIVDAADPAFRHPQKFIGPVYNEADAKGLAERRGWSVAPDGAKWRRVVPSPEPQAIVELEAIRTLASRCFTVICAGGGGIPVALGRDGRLWGSEAVVDKDLVAALLAIELGADALLLLTDVDAVYDSWGTPEAQRVVRATPEELRVMSLPAGSMRPKVEAICRFVERTGGLGAIGKLADAELILGGRAGTSVTLAARRT